MNDAWLRGRFVRYQRRGDGEALAAVFDATAPTLRRLAQRIPRGGLEVDDLVQATYLIAIERAERYDAARPLMPWLIGILVHLARNASRRSDAVITRERDGVAVSALIDRAGKSALQGLVDREAQDALRSAMATLPPLYREVVTRHVEAGQSGVEIAVALSRPPGTVRSQLQRGVALLRSLLPRSFATGGALAALSSASDAALRDMRDRVLMAGQSTAGSAVVVPLLPTVGVSLVSFKIALAVGLLALVTWWFTTSGPASAPVEMERDSRPSVEVPVPPKATSGEREVAEASTQPVAKPQPRERGFVAAPVPFTFVSGGQTEVRGLVVDDATGRPVEGAQVWVFMGTWIRMEPPEWAVVTGPDGRFRMEGLNSQRFRTLLVRSDRHSLATVELGVRPQRLADEGGIDAGTIRLHRGATLVGRVIDAHGASVPDAMILLNASRYAATFLPGFSRVIGRSDASGSFRIEHVPPSDWAAWTLFAFSERGAGGLQVDIAVGRSEVDGLELRLQPSASLVVTVVDEDGATVADAQVEAVPLSPPYIMHDMSDPMYRERPDWIDQVRRLRIPYETVSPYLRTWTDASGVARLDCLPVRTGGAPYTLRAYKEGHLITFEDIVTLHPDRPNAFTLTLVEEFTRVIRGVVKDAGGRGVPDVEVRLYRYYQGRFSAHKEDCRTGPDGSFQFPDQKPLQQAHVVAAVPGMVWQPYEVRIPMDRDPEPVEIVLSRATPLRGVVMDQHGAPVEGAMFSAEQDGTVLMASGPESDRDGRFEFPDATRGEWHLAVMLPEPHDQWRVHQFQLDVIAGGDDVRVVAERETPGHARLVGEVFDSATGAPLYPQSAFLQRRDVSDHVASYSAVSGIQRMEGRVVAERLKVGRWVLIVTCDGKTPARVPFEVAPGDVTVSLRVPIGEVGMLTGVVRLEDGATMPKQVILQRPPAAADGAQPYMLRPEACSLDEAGKFRFEDVPAGLVTVRVAEEGVAGEAEVVVTPAAVSDCELVVRPVD